MMYSAEKEKAFLDGQGFQSRAKLDLGPAKDHNIDTLKLFY